MFGFGKKKVSSQQEYEASLGDLQNIDMSCYAISMRQQQMAEQMQKHQDAMLRDMQESAWDVYSPGEAAMIREEEELRETNPTLKDAWEQYQITLKLVRYKGE